MVRCRLQPKKKERGIDGLDDDSKDRLTGGIRFDLSGMPHEDEDDNELEVCLKGKVAAFEGLQVGNPFFFSGRDQ